MKVTFSRLSLASVREITEQIVDREQVSYETNFLGTGWFASRCRFFVRSKRSLSKHSLFWYFKQDFFSGRIFCWFANIIIFFLHYYKLCTVVLTLPFLSKHRLKYFLTWWTFGRCLSKKRLGELIFNLGASIFFRRKWSVKEPVFATEWKNHNAAFSFTFSSDNFSKCSCASKISNCYLPVSYFFLKRNRTLFVYKDHSLADYWQTGIFAWHK